MNHSESVCTVLLQKLVSDSISGDMFRPRGLPSASLFFHFFLRGTSAALFFGVCLSLLAFLREVGPPTLFELFELQFLKTRCTVVYRSPLAAGISYFERDQDI